MNAAHKVHHDFLSMKSCLRPKVWWPRKDKDVVHAIKACKISTLVGILNPSIPMKGRQLPEDLWIDVSRTISYRQAICKRIVSIVLQRMQY